MMNESDPLRIKGETKQKGKQKLEQSLEQKPKQNLKQKLLLLMAQTTEYSLLRTVLAVTLLTSMGIFGRTAFQYIPSVEPLTPISILIGFFFGPIAGFVSGASGFFASNFLVWGGQGPWTLFQSLGAGLAGLIGGVFGKFGSKSGSKSRWKMMLSTAIGIVAYELVVSVGMGAMIGLFNPFLTLVYVITSLPFSLVHLFSSLGFSAMFYEFKEQLKKLKGGKIIEKEILGLRAIDSDSSKHGYKLVPDFYCRKIFGSRKNNKDKPDDRFWFVRRIFKREEQSD